jgi:hypothetical protein
MNTLILFLLLSASGDLVGAKVVGPAADQVDCAKQAEAMLEANAEAVAGMKAQGVHVVVRCVDSSPHPVVKGTRTL